MAHQLKFIYNRNRINTNGMPYGKTSTSRNAAHINPSHAFTLAIKTETDISNYSFKLSYKMHNKLMSNGKCFRYFKSGHTNCNCPVNVTTTTTTTTTVTALPLTVGCLY